MSGPVDPRLLRHAHAARGGIAGLGALGTASALTTVATVIALAHLVTEPSTTWLGLLAGAFAARALLIWAEQVVAARTAARVADELRQNLLTAMVMRGPAWAASFGAGRLTALLTEGLSALRPWFTGYLPSLVVAVVLPPLVLLTMAFVDPASALIAALTLPLIPVFGALVGWATAARAAERWRASARLSGHFLDAVQGLATLRMFGRAERQVAVVEEMTDRHRVATLRVLRLAFLSSTALDLVATLSVGLIAVETGLRVAAGSLPLTPALLVILLAPEAYRPLREVGAAYHTTTEADAVIAEVDEVLTYARAQHFSPGTGSIEATGVRAGYGTTDALALPDLSLHAGDFVALRGPSGAGKTTALRVLAGLHEPRVGTVTVTGLRPLYLPQRPTLPHSRTVREALLIEELDETRPPDEVLRQALAVVGLDLPLDTPLGEQGKGLSSGQRHRVALARLLREANTRPTLLLLDEPTAHLDPRSEDRVIEQLQAAAANGCTVLVVAHRPALLAAATRSILLEAPLRLPRDHASKHTPPPVRQEAFPEVRTFRNGSLAVALGAGSWLAGITLTAAATWLLVRASSLPPVLTLSAAIVTVRASAVTRPLLRYLERLVSHEVAFRRLGRRRADVYAGLIPKTPGPGLSRRGELLTRVVHDVDAEVDGLLRGTYPAIAAVATLGIATTAAVVLEPRSALVLGAGLLIAAVVAPALAVRQTSAVADESAASRAHLADAMVESVAGLEDLAGRGTGPTLTLPAARSRALAAIETRAATWQGTATAVSYVGLGIIVTGLARLTTGLPKEWAAVLILGTLALAEPLLTLPAAAQAVRQAREAKDRLPAPGATAPIYRKPGPDWAVEGLVAGWGPAQEPCLRGVDLRIRPGEKVAVTGASGSGKSTMAAVFAGLLAPRRGTCSGPSDPTGFSAPVILVGDETDHVFATTVRENLRLADPLASDGRLLAVLEETRLSDWLARLPEGLDTWLGAAGSTMSGGERRRFATARALLADPALLILDEPTEGLDERSARGLMADLLSAGSGRAVLLFTHRTEGPADVDAWHTLENGKLHESTLRQSSLHQSTLHHAAGSGR